MINSVEHSAIVGKENLIEKIETAAAELFGRLTEIGNPITMKQALLSYSVGPMILVNVTTGSCLTVKEFSELTVEDGTFTLEVKFSDESVTGLNEWFDLEVTDLTADQYQLFVESDDEYELEYIPLTIYDNINDGTLPRWVVETNQRIPRPRLIDSVTSHDIDEVMEELVGSQRRLLVLTPGKQNLYNFVKSTIEVLDLVNPDRQTVNGLYRCQDITETDNIRVINQDGLNFCYFVILDEDNTIEGRNIRGAELFTAVTGEDETTLGFTCHSDDVSYKLEDVAFLSFSALAASL